MKSTLNKIKVEQDIDILPISTVHSVNENNNENKGSKSNNDTTTRHNLRTRKEGTHRNAYEKEFQNMQHQNINTKLKIEDRFRHAVSMLMKRNRENDEYTQVSLNK